MGRIKDYYFDEINNSGEFDDFFEDEMEAMYQPVLNSKEAKKAAKAAKADLTEETVEETESDPLNDDTYGI